MRYLVFVPRDGASQPTSAEVLKSVGLEDHVGGEVVKVEPAGPMGATGGFLFYWQPPGPLKGAPKHYIAETEQTWYHNATKGYYVGVWNDDPPKESELRREKSQRGTFIPLGNGERWKITAGHNIDSEIKWGDDWSAVPVPLKKYSYFTDAVQKVYDSKTVDGDKVFYSFTWKDKLDLVVMSIQINYMVVPEVLNHLSLFTMETIEDAAEIITGLTFIRDKVED